MMTPIRCERGGDQERVMLRDVVKMIKFSGGPLRAEKLNSKQTVEMMHIKLITLKKHHHRLIPSLSVSSHYFIAVHCVRMKIVQCHIVLLVSYGEEVSVVETINSHTLVVALI